MPVINDRAMACKDGHVCYKRSRSIAIGEWYGRKKVKLSGCDWQIKSWCLPDCGQVDHAAAARQRIYFWQTYGDRRTKDGRFPFNRVHVDQRFKR